MSIFKKLFNKEKPKEAKNEFYSFPVAEIRRETDKAVTLVFDKPQEGFDFIPGQYLTLKTTIDGQELRRAYSLCNLPSENTLQVTVKETPDGFFSKYVNNEVEVGDLIDVLPPNGKFTFKADSTKSRNIVCFAGGSGITPIFSILQSALIDEPNSKIILFYGNRTQSDIIFKARLENLAEQYEQFQLVHILSDEQESDYTPYYGFIDSEKVQQFSQDFFNANEVDGFYLCGPGAMTTVITDALMNLGVAKQKIHTELFSAPLENESAPTSAKANKKDEIVVGGQVKATYSGESKTLDYTNAKKSILDVALDSGMKVPFSCLNGVCSTCSAKLKEGQVKMNQNFALEQEDLENGYILTCQSHPTTDFVDVDWDDNRI